jgi:hypothetical protein
VRRWPGDAKQQPLSGVPNVLQSPSSLSTRSYRCAALRRTPLPALLKFPLCRPLLTLKSYSDTRPSELLRTWTSPPVPAANHAFYLFYPPSLSRFLALRIAVRSRAT